MTDRKEPFMKKLVSALLSILLIFIGMTVFADTSCEHVNRTQQGSCPAIDKENAYDNGDGTHTGPLCNVTQYYCEDCSDVFSVWSEPVSSKTESHYFENGVCTVCRAENPCVHPEETQTLLETGR